KKKGDFLFKISGIVMKIKLLSFLFTVFLPNFALTQEVAFYLNEGLINDNSIILEGKNWMICHPDGSGSIVVGDRVSIWDIATGKVLKNIEVGNKAVLEVSITAKEKYLVLAGRQEID